MAELSIIAAIGKGRELGKNNDLLWHIPADLKRFMRITSGHTVIMGRKTFESIGCRPLKNRRNIIITRKEGYTGNGAEVTSSVPEALERVETDGEVFILGGAEIYRQLLPAATRMYLTHVHRNYDADVYFPEYNENEWEIEFREDVADDEKAGVGYSFINYMRKQI